MFPHCMTPKIFIKMKLKFSIPPDTAPHTNTETDTDTQTRIRGGGVEEGRMKEGSQMPGPPPHEQMSGHRPAYHGIPF